MNACPADDQLRQLLTEPPPPAAPLTVHVDRCPDCQQRLKEMQAGPTVGYRLENPTGPAPPFVTVITPSRGPQAQPPLAVPGYEVLGLLGRGGMGVVYKARQTQLNRLVALKVIAAGAHASDGHIERFRTEAQAVARFQHPNIVQIHEVGEAAGVLYLALEYVDGGSLDRRLNGTPQPPRDAAALVEVLARAMQAAHDKGIVHRDLKPGNVLLASVDRHSVAGPNPDDRHGVSGHIPKITDFGLAKEMESASALTHTGEVLGTPSYMAPEQAEGDVRRIGPVTDVYALGAILYEVLTGRPPFKGANILETLDQVRTQAPVPPRQLLPKLPRDLETICLKCLEKDPPRRYAGGAALADDLRRFLDGLPIVARPARLWEKAVKMGAAPRPTAASLAAMSVVAGVGLVAGGFWHGVRVGAERDRAERNFVMAMGAVKEMIKEVSDEVNKEQLAPDKSLEPKRRALLKHAQNFLRRYLEQPGDTPSERLRSGQAYGSLGDTERLLGQYAAAQEAYAAGAALLRPLHDQAPRQPECAVALARCLNYLGEALRLDGKALPAEKAYEEAQGLWEQLPDDHPAAGEHRRKLAQTIYNRGILCKDAGRPGESEKHFTRAVVLLRAGVKEKPEEQTHRQYLARACLNLGTQRTAKRFAEAEDACLEAIGLLRVLTKEDPDSPEYRHELGIVLNNLGHVRMDRERPTAARADHEQALALFERLANNHPGVPKYHQERANTYNSLANALSQSGQHQEAVKHWEKAVEFSSKLCEQYRGVASYRGDLGQTLGNFGYALAVQGGHEAARTKLEAAVRHTLTALNSQPDNPDYHEAVRNQRRTLAELLIRLKDHAPAAEVAADLGRGAGKAYPPAEDVYFAACFLARCAKLAMDSGRQDAAKSYGKQSLAHLREACRRGHRVTGKSDPMPEDLFRSPLGSEQECRQLVQTLRGK